MRSAGIEPQPGDDVPPSTRWRFANTISICSLKRWTTSSSSRAPGTQCVEATVRFAAELGYDVTMVKDATASYSDKEMHAAIDINIPNYASAVMTTNEVIESISSLKLRNQYAVVNLTISDR